MRKIMFIILSVIVLLCVGCSNDETSSETKENVVGIDEKDDEIKPEVSDEELSVKEVETMRTMLTQPLIMKVTVAPHSFITYSKRAA